jgi:thiol-disulfide isomerase/thioredoxin
MAKTAAKEYKKPIILVFQGSDWCAPCIKLDHEVWSTPTFQKYAAENYVMLQADFPRKKTNQLSEQQSLANKLLAEKYNQKGIFPLVVVLNADGKELGQTSYKRLAPKEYIRELNRYLN